MLVKSILYGCSFLGGDKKMAQTIKKVGTIIAEVEKNVVFNNRELRELKITENENVVVNYVNLSDEGSKEMTAVVPFDLFHEKVEQSLWEAIDEASGV